jgi:hypothetical protein
MGGIDRCNLPFGKSILYYILGYAFFWIYIQQENRKLKILFSISLSRFRKFQMFKLTQKL